jgi:hypothetical protein
VCRIPFFDLIVMTSFKSASSRACISEPFVYLLQFIFAYGCWLGIFGVFQGHFSEHHQLSKAKWCKHPKVRYLWRQIVPRPDKPASPVSCVLWFITVLLSFNGSWVVHNITSCALSLVHERVVPKFMKCTHEGTYLHIVIRKFYCGSMLPPSIDASFSQLGNLTELWVTPSPRTTWPSVSIISCGYETTTYDW